MVADQWYDINGVWTGSVTFLKDDTLVMLYTGATENMVQVQSLAYPANASDPLLLEWVKYSNNPILVPPPGIGIKDFRDPTTAWLTPEGKWRIAIGSKLNKTGITLLYDTVDFKNYERIEGYMHTLPGTGIWECVDFYPVSKSSNNGLDTSTNGPEVKHIIANVGLKDLTDFLPASLETIISYFSAEVTRGLWKPVFMNETDWPSPVANLANVEEKITKILAATGVDVPTIAKGESSPATLPLPLAAFVNLTITYKIDKASERFLNLVGPALEVLAAGCPWPCMPIVASLWTL